MTFDPDLRMSPHRRLVLMLMLQEPERTWYGYEIVTRLNMQPGTVYTIMHRFAEAGWLTSSRETVAVAQFSGRPRRRLYRFTEGGLRLARERLSTGNTRFFLNLAATAELSIGVVTRAPRP